MIATMTWMARGTVVSAGMLAIPLLTASLSTAQDADRTVAGGARPCAGDNGGITPPPRFFATGFAYVPRAMGDYVENTGTTSMRFLEIFPSRYFADVSLDQWMAFSGACGRTFGIGSAGCGST